MAALATDRATAAKFLQRSVSYKVAASTKIYGGSMVSLNSSGYAIPAADTASTICVGRAESFVDNSAGADGDLSVTVFKGVFKWDNNSTDIGQAQIGTTATVKDDHTVSKASVTTNDIGAGIIDEIDADGGIWVATLT